MVGVESEGLTEAQIQEFKCAFNEFDINKEGSISSSELSSVMKHLGQNPSEEDVLKMIRKVDKNGNGVIEFEEFVEMMKTFLKETDEANVAKDIFSLFDKNKNGLISTKELRHMMKSLGEKLSPKQISQMMAFADLNRDGSIDFEEFQRLMREVPHVKVGLERVASNS